MIQQGHYQWFNLKNPKNLMGRRDVANRETVDFKKNKVCIHCKEVN